VTKRDWLIVALYLAALLLAAKPNAIIHASSPQQGQWITRFCDPFGDVVVYVLTEDDDTWTSISALPVEYVKDIRSCREGLVGFDGSLPLELKQIEDSRDK
jgi:hypothetical protein